MSEEPTLRAQLAALGNIRSIVDQYFSISLWYAIEQDLIRHMDSVWPNEEVVFDNELACYLLVKKARCAMCDITEGELTEIPAQRTRFHLCTKCLKNIRSAPLLSASAGLPLANGGT